MILYILCAILFCIGVWGALAKRNLIKIVVSLAIVEYSLFLFFALLGYRSGGVAPIETPDTAAEAASGAVTFVDPLPQAIVLTAIVIGLGATALLVSTVVRIHGKYGTLDVRALRRLRE